MKLYKISQDVNEGYDTYDSAVVAAPDIETARKMSPLGNDGEEYKIEPIWCEPWCLSEFVTVEYLGEATEGIKQGVICASFNAG